MKIKIYFDASFIPETKASGISVIIRNENGTLILISSKKVKCKNSNEAEFRALNKAIGYLNNRQSRNLIPKGCFIKLYGDNQSVIEIARRSQRMKGIEKSLMLNFLKELGILSNNNTVIFKWIKRSKNLEAHQNSKLLINK
jgi:ribonuclease HI